VHRTKVIDDPETENDHSREGHRVALIARQSFSLRPSTSSAEEFGQDEELTEHAGRDDSPSDPKENVHRYSPNGLELSGDGSAADGVRCSDLLGVPIDYPPTVGREIDCYLDWMPPWYANLYWFNERLATGDLRKEGPIPGFQVKADLARGTCLSDNGSRSRTDSLHNHSWNRASELVPNDDDQRFPSSAIYRARSHAEQSCGAKSYADSG